jgi:long-chain acyl-CoA synthetase
MATILHRLADWAKETPLAPAQRYKKNGTWQSITAREYCDRV